MEYLEFLYKIERSLREVVQTCYPASWDENHITFSITEKLYSRNQLISIKGFDRPFKIIWDVRKLRRPEETDFGDLAVLVNLKTWAGETIEGVGLLEAKRRDTDTVRFSSASPSQLKRIASKAASAQLLLYDYDDVTACLDNVSFEINARYFSRVYRPIQATHCVSIPARTALQFKSHNTALHKFGVPLSYQIVARYFRGFDLEFAPGTVNAVKGNIGRHGGSRTLIMVGVSTGSAEPQLPTINDERYGRFG